MNNRDSDCPTRVHSLHPTRRRVLAGSVALAAAGGAALSAPRTALGEGRGEGDEYEALRQTWCDLITGGSLIDPEDPDFQRASADLDSRVDGFASDIVREDGRTRVFESLDLDQQEDDTPFFNTYKQLMDFATAWHNPASAHHNDPQILSDLREGLETTYDLVYHPNGEKFGNWWSWEIGAPKRLADILMLLDKELTDDEKAKYQETIEYWVPSPLERVGSDGIEETTGANRTSMCLIVVEQGISSRDAERIALGASGIAEVCEAVDSDENAGIPGEGFWPDGSFIQHGLPYTGGYGKVLIEDLTKLMAGLAGSSWELSDPAIANFYAMIDEYFAPVIHDRRVMSFVNGRFVSRVDEQEHSTAEAIITGILRLAHGEVTDKDTIDRWRGRVQGWTERSGYDPMSESGTVSLALYKEQATSGVDPLPEPEDSVVFTNGARAVHRRDRWAFAISMSSNRIDRYESINGYNLHGWHTGSGMTYFYDDDNTQYTDAFWPTVDPYRLAGTTVDNCPMDDSEGTATTRWRWASGVVLDDTYSAVGMGIDAAKTDLTGRKSWFCLDEYIFCLGHGITNGSGYDVETIVENRNLHESSPTITVDGKAFTDDETFPGASWVHLDGVAGYLFPASGEQDVRVEHTTRTGSWADIDESGSDTEITRHYATVSIPHGAGPTNAGYSYLYVPKATTARMEELATDRDVEIVNHNPDVHAIHQPATGITMANLWTAPGACNLTRSAGRIQVDHHCAVIVQEKDDTLTIAVADTLRSSDTIRVTITPQNTGYTLDDKDDAITVVSLGADITLDVADGELSATHTATLTR